MKRAIRWLAVSIAVVAVMWWGGQFALTAWIAHKMNDEAHSMHEGHVIVDEIKAHDPTVNATWTNTDDGQPDVVVRNILDANKQDAIIAWAKAVKQQGRVHRSITIDFQKEISHRDIPDTVLRTVEF